ncbi:hypothetical protein [Ornithinimicrobium sp. W1665]|uniref:hypothetical protein n=1 Tax=Ornithinimicrobium sp. W1665 TaxID=3416666 RepID=UPI003D6BBE52
MTSEGTGTSGTRMNSRPEPNWKTVRTSLGVPGTNSSSEARAASAYTTVGFRLVLRRVPGPGPAAVAPEGVGRSVVVLTRRPP